MDNEEISGMPPSGPHLNEALMRKVESLPIKVLIAEDDDPIRKMLSQSLASGKYEIVEAIDGEQAWQALENKEDPPRIAVLDWMMPKIDGLSLCRKIKAREDPFVFTIMLTARVSDQDIRTALRAGADDFLAKPFNLDVLKSRVAAGARVVRLEKLLSMKDAILEYYKKKVKELTVKDTG